MDRYSSLKAVLAILLTASIFQANAQISTSCTSSMIATFTPCLNYITRSSATGSSPTQDCCNSLKSLMSDSMDCTCLIITGNVPLSIPFVNRQLAISLPRICQTSVPVQCKAAGTPLPPAGPALFAPAPAPSSASQGLISPTAAKPGTVEAPSDDQVQDLSPAPEPPSGQIENPRMRPVQTPNSATGLSFSAFSLSSVIVLYIGSAVFKLF